jgi:lipopolysaccharide biosynthesis glycosyltransferase
MTHNERVKEPILSQTSQFLQSDDERLDSRRLARCLVMACDESYAMQLATALRSIVDANRSGEPLDVHVLSDRFSEDMRQKVVDSLPQGSASIRWAAVDLTSFEEFRTLPHVSKMTYARLTIPRIFADSVRRVLYLDADLLVLDDLGPLWDMNLNGAVVGAVLDRADAHLKARVPVPNDEVPYVRDYFNAGILLIDLDRWRKERISENAMDYLRCHPGTKFMDQDALNVACDGRWMALDPRWNFQEHFDTAVLGMMPAERPKIVHFAGHLKPWDADTLNSNAGLYDTFRSRTLFARTTGEKTRDLGSSTLRRMKNALKRASLAQSISNGFRRYSSNEKSGA